MFEAHCIPRTVALFVGTFLALRYKSGSRRIIRDRGGLQFRIGGNRCVQGLPKLRHFGRDDGTGIQICHAIYLPAAYSSRKELWAAHLGLDPAACRRLSGTTNVV